MTIIVPALQKPKTEPAPASTEPLTIEEAISAGLELVSREGATPKHIYQAGLLYCGHQPTCDFADMAFPRP